MVKKNKITFKEFPWYLQVVSVIFFINLFMGVVLIFIMIIALIVGAFGA